MSDDASNTVPVQEHLDGKIDALERHLDVRIQALERHVLARIEEISNTSATANEVAKEAVEKAEQAVERRLGALNELRELVADYQRSLLPRTEASSMIKNLEDKIGRLEKVHTEQAGRERGLAAGWSYVIAVTGLLGIVAGILIAVLN